MATTFTPAPEVETIARELIREHHEHLITRQVRVEYCFRSDVPSRAGKDVWGTCRKISSLNAYLAGDEDGRAEGETPNFFVITISLPVWERLLQPARVALVDHELSHAYADEDDDGETRLKVLSHDLEEFRAVVARHGFWRPDVEDFAATCAGARAQLDLPLEDEDERGAHGLASVTISTPEREVTLTRDGELAFSGTWAACVNQVLGEAADADQFSTGVCHGSTVGEYRRQMIEAADACGVTVDTQERTGER